MEEPPLQALVAKAHLLKSLNRPGEAFAFLHGLRADYWDEPDFLAAYIDIGHAADEDRHAHEAFQRLLSIQQGGQTEHEYIRAATLDDLREHIEDYGRRREAGYREILGGRLPWILVDEALGSVPYWAWRLRTQEIGWISEHPLEAARYTIYSTNGYAVDRSMDRLAPLNCPERGATVVADRSALITLHRLGLLRQTVEYCERIVVPIEYLAQAELDAEQLVTHQLSQKTSVERLHQAIDARRIRIDDSGDADVLLVDDYPSQGSTAHHYGLVDLIPALRASGHITDETQADLRAIARSPSGVDISHPSIVPGTRLRIALQTLKTLAACGVLSQLLSVFEVLLTSPEENEVAATVRAYEAQNEVRQWHTELWDYVRDEPKIVKVPCQGDKEVLDQASDRELPRDLSLLATAHAIREGLHLISDDRMCQMLAINHPGTDLRQHAGRTRSSLVCTARASLTTIGKRTRS